MFDSIKTCKSPDTIYTTAFSVLLLLLASEVRVPIGVVPITLQTFVVFLLGLRLDKRSSISTGLLFVAIKLATLPFWSCPSFGYIIGMGLSIPSMYFVRQFTCSKIVDCVVGYLITNIFGCIWLYVFLRNWILVWQYGLEPFILIEVFKSTVAICVSAYFTQSRNNF